jgi:D-glycero-alpha-D-manno-heptose-7-phosphate kinase
MMIRARAPLRLGLAGGGTDVSPYCDLHGGNVLNATIDRYAYAVLKVTTDASVRLFATDQGVSALCPLEPELPLDGCLNLHKAVYNHVVRHFHGGKPIAVELSTYCDAPIGSGLGSSSTLVVAIIKAFVELLNLGLDDYAVAQLAFKIERVDCGLAGGRQDQYSATFGGVNFMEFHAGGDRVTVNSLRVKSWIMCELEASLLLFFTGVSRESARIISDQSQNVKLGDADAIEAMHGLKQEALVMKDCLIRGDFGGLVRSMSHGWESKKRSARTVTNPRIDELYEAALAAGALAGKISGAGGGGFMLFYVPAEHRMDVVRAISPYKGQVSNCHFTKYGCQAWKV